MTVQTRGRIRHIALSVKDPWETAEFYKQAVGLQEIMELDGPLAEGVFLSDGVVNLAILHFKSDEASQGTGMDFVGIHHIGFWVDDVVDRARSRATSARPGSWATLTTRTATRSSTPTSMASSSTSPRMAGSDRRRTPASEGNVERPNPQRRLAKFDERRARAYSKFAAMRGKRVPQAAE